MPVEVGVGYVSVVPEARGFGRLLQQQIDGESAQVGVDAGQQAGQGFLGGIGGTLKKGIAGVAAGAGVLFAAGFVEAVEQDKSNAKLGAQLGLTERESARAGKLAGKVYASGYGESVDQVNQSLKALAQNGVASINAPRKELAGLSKSALNLAEAFDVDVADAARAAGQMMRTGLAENGRQAFDLLTVGFQNGADKGGDFIDTMNEYGTQFRKIGLDGATSIGLISQALQAGARDSDVAADSLKEFSIRAVDGSKTTADGFKMLGLNADDMAAKFAQGGTAATGVLDLTLDRLRGIKDPVLQSQAAVALFGTQAEDLGASLLAMDPTTAAGALGEVGGAADKMGKTLHSTATQPLEVFKRQALQGLANFANKYALPALKSFGHFLNVYVLPPARIVGGALASVLVPAVEGTAGALAAGARWVRDYGAWLIPLGIAIGGVAVVAGASTIATWGMTAAFSVYRGVILAATAVTRGWAVAQGILNAVMAANPVGLIVVGILALVAAAVVAYNKVGWFREAVQATWAGIKSGWDVLWNAALKPGFAALMVGVRAVGSWASWLWTTAIGPAFRGIMTVAKVLFTVLTVVVITPIMLYLKALGAVAGWLWQHAIGPAFRGIVTLAQWWWAGVKLYFGLVKNVISAVGAAGMWLWQKAIAPAFRGIVTLASWWWTGVKLYFGYVKTGITAVGAAGTWLYRNAIQPAFTAIASAASFLWTKGLKPIFDTGKRGVGLFGAAFDTAQKAIGIAFGKIKDVTKKPVNFVIGTVYSNGIKKVWDGVAGFVGLDKLPAAPKLLAEGGRTRGGIPGKDSIPALMMADEFVVRRDSARSVGFDTLNYINRYGELPVQRFADGGIVGDVAGWIGGKAKTIGSAVMDGADFLSNPGKLWDKATKFVREKIASIGQSRFAQMIGKVPIKMLSGLKDKIVKAASSMFGGSSADIGGSGVQRWSSVVLQALKLVGQPASLLPTVLRRMNQESGGNPRAINNWDINARNGTPSKGLMQVIDPTFNAYAGKLRSRGVWDPLANIYASMRYALSRYGSLASAYNRPGGYANGGRPRPGEVAWVGENGPELLQFGGGQTVLDTDSSLAAVGAAMVRSMARSLPQPVPTAANLRPVVPVAGGQATTPAGHTYNIYPRTLDMTVSDLELLQRRQDALARVGRPR
ncbi:phage tail tape measure protein [Streptomyces sp. NPDC006527]|uniref:phage tail tape measure protein n=1 Tax=Streptomyces sp. NPDC006527 TaxID=3364749 RepID=UPI0036B5C871